MCDHTTGGRRAHRRRTAGLAALAVLLGVLPACGGSSHRVAHTPIPTSTTVPSLADLPMQAAARQAVDGVPLPTDLVVMRASTGQILAAVSHGDALAPDDAFNGRYPTGSTFKIVTAVDLLEHGKDLTTPASCPASITADGQTLTNFDGRSHPIADLDDAFAQSCNTAFAILAQELPNASFRTVANELGIGVPLALGRPAFAGTVQTPVSAFERATVGSDGGRSLVSPLAMVTAAATIAAGRRPTPHLGGGSGSVTSSTLPPPVTEGLRSMMADAVTRGTASGYGLPPDTHAKTGTAELVDAPEPRTVYAWLIGYRGDIAFAVLVVGGQEGGPVAGPIAAALLRAIG